MLKMNSIKILTTGVALALVSCPQAWAAFTQQNCSDANGLMCWKCGTLCTATLYDGGELVVSGTGEIWEGYNSSVLLQSNNPNLPQAITSVKINEGITTIGSNAFYISTIKKVELADSVTTINSDGLHTGPYQLTITENSSITSFDTYYPSAALVSSVFCKGDVNICRNKLEASHSAFQNKTISDELRDADGKLLEKCSSSGCITYDSAEHKTAKYSLDDKLMEKYDTLGNVIEEYAYDANGNLLSKKTYGDGGTFAIYDASGRLIGAKKASPFTPAEAAALIKKGNDNKVTLTFK